MFTHHSTPRRQHVRLTFHGWSSLALGIGLQSCWLHNASHPPIEAVMLPLPLITALLGLHVLWLNRGYWPLWIMGAGGILNLLAMAMNGGLMPISPAVRHAIGAPVARLGAPLALGKDRLLPDEAAHLAVLGDRVVVHLDHLRFAASIGDSLIVSGLLLTVFVVCRRSLEGHPLRGRAT